MVVFARFVVLLRQLNGIVAGTTGMHWATFGIANAIGAALWVGVWTTLAYRFGRSAHDFLPFLWHHLHLLAVILVPLLIVGLGVLWLRTRGAEPACARRGDALLASEPSLAKTGRALPRCLQAGLATGAGRTAGR